MPDIPENFSGETQLARTRNTKPQTEESSRKDRFQKMENSPSSKGPPNKALQR